MGSNKIREILQKIREGEKEQEKCLKMGTTKK